MLHTIQALLDAFHKNNIIYCHWKSNEHLSLALNGDTDLDILFLVNQSSKINEILYACGLKRFRAVPLMQYNAIEDYIGLDKNTGKIWHLHLHYRLTLGEKHLKGYTLPWEKELLSHAIWSETYSTYCMNPTDEYWLLLLRLAMKFRLRDIFCKIKEDDLCEIKWLAEKTKTEDILSRVQLFFDDTGVDKYKELLSQKLIYHRQFINLRKYLQVYLAPFTGYRGYESYAKKAVREFFWCLSGIMRRLNIRSSNPSRRLFPNGGHVIAFVGSDGAGKSTIVSKTYSEFKKKIDVITLYMGSGNGSCSLLRFPMKLVARHVGGKGLGHKVENELQNQEHNSLKSRMYHIAKVIWATALMLEKRNLLKKMVKCRNNGLLVLTDRYPQIDTPGYGDGPLLSGFLNRPGFLSKLAKQEYQIYYNFYRNPPDVIIYLSAPVELAIQRKPEMTIQEIKSKKAAIEKISIKSPKIKVDTSTTIDTTFCKVMNIIWDYI